MLCRVNVTLPCSARGKDAAGGRVNWMLLFAGLAVAELCVWSVHTTLMFSRMEKGKALPGVLFVRMNHGLKKLGLVRSVCAHDTSRVYTGKALCVSHQ